MAHSLKVQHTELPSTNPLLNRFLMLAVVWMALATLAAMAVDTAPIDDAPTKDAKTLISE
jgi:hypothetical protein